ncbi:MAG TPA: lysylphosphatidylglycerol synthase domain-containing protein, partial [Bryobacteraceae bacterium]
FVMRALGLSATLTIALLLTTGLALSSALPSTPGYVGIYQFVAVSVLTPFGFRKTNAIAFILLFQVLQYIVISFWAAWGTLLSRSVPLPETESAATSLNERSA